MKSKLCTMCKIEKLINTFHENYARVLIVKEAYNVILKKR